jgi:hypothetical protein
MHPSLAHLAIALLLAGWSVPATAASLSFTGTLTHQLWGTFAAVSFTGAGVATSSGGGFSLPANAFLGTEYATTPSWVAPPVTGNTHAIQAQGAGSFSGSPLGGSMPLAGHIKFLAYGGLTLFSLPLSGPGGAVGAGGSFTVLVAALPGGMLTVQAAPWTTGTQSLPAFTFTPPTGPLVPTAGFDNRNAKGVGTTRLVSHYALQTSSGLLSLGLMSLDLTFVPEPPGTAAVTLACGALVALRLGSARRRG